jgi:hypothetical protein
MILAPAERRLLRHLAIATALVVLAATVHVAGRAAAAAQTTPPADIVHVSSTSMVPGQSVQRYQTTVTNRGAPTEIVVPAPLPVASIVDATTDSGSFADGTWTIGRLDSGATATLELTARN